MAEPRGGRRGAALSAERDFLLRSLEDLENEHRAGDVDEADYEALRASYVERAAATLRALETGEGQEPGASGSPRRPLLLLRRRLGRARTRRILGAGAVLCLVGVLVLVALSLAGVRLPGQSATGSVNLPANESVAQQLSAASVLGSEDQLVGAISLYSAVLAKEPHNAEALTYRAWLVRLVGLEAGAQDELATGDAELSSAASSAPGYAPARAFFGLALLQDRHDPNGAIVQFAAFLDDHPSSALLSSLGPEIAQAFVQAKVRVPAPFANYLGASARVRAAPSS